MTCIKPKCRLRHPQTLEKRTKLAERSKALKRKPKGPKGTPTQTVAPAMAKTHIPKNLRGLKGALKIKGWKLMKEAGHDSYRRVVEAADGSGHCLLQSYTLFKSPSDTRSWDNTISQVNRLDKAAAEWLDEVRL